MWDWLVRMWRIEWALFICYWYALWRGDRYSCRYCTDHSILVSAFWLALFISPILFQLFTR